MIIDELNKKIADIENLANDKTGSLESKVNDLTDGILMVADAVDTIPEMVDEKITAITKEFSTIKDTVSKVKAQKGEKGAKGDKGDKGDTGEKGDNGKDGSPDTGEQIADKLNELEGVLDTKVLKDFIMPDVKDLERQINTIGNQTLRLLSRPATSATSTGGVSSINGLTSDVTISAGNNVTLSESGNDIEITANFTQQGKYMISGGAVWSGTGLTYDVSIISYFFNGVKSGSQASVTLDPSDPTFNRLDSIVIDESGTISVITGVPSASPVTPPIPEDQLEVQIVLVEAGSTTPTIQSENIYLDDPTSDWTFSTYTTGTATGSIDFAGTNSPKQGVNDIEASTDARLGARFVRSTSFDAFQYTMLQVWVRFTGTAVATNKALNVRFENSAGTLVANTVNLFNYGLQRNVLNTWQLVVVPITAFGALPSTVKGLKVIMTGGTVGAVRQWDIDYMILTNGSVPFANVPTIAFYKDNVGIASQSGLNIIEGTGVEITSTNNPTNQRVDYIFSVKGQTVTEGAPTQADRASVDLTVLDADYADLVGVQLKFGSVPNQSVLEYYNSSETPPSLPVLGISLTYTKAQAIYRLNGAYANGDTITIGSRTYTLQDTLTNVDGNIQRDLDDSITTQNIRDAINLTGTPGTQYATAMTANTDVSAEASDAGFLAKALEYGTSGNSISISTSSANGNAWDTPTLEGGAQPTVAEVAELTQDEMIKNYLLADGKLINASYSSGDTLTVYVERPGTYGNGIAVDSTDDAVVSTSSSTMSGGNDNGTAGNVGSLRKGIVEVENFKGNLVKVDALFTAISDNVWMITSSTGNTSAKNSYKWTNI